MLTQKKCSPIPFALSSVFLLCACAQNTPRSEGRSEARPMRTSSFLVGEKASASFINREIRREIVKLEDSRKQVIESKDARISASQAAAVIMAEPAKKPEVAEASLPRKAASAKAERVPVLVNPEYASGEIASAPENEVTVLPSRPLRRLNELNAPDIKLAGNHADTPLIFELPVIYNSRVKDWLEYFTTNGRQSFKVWLERSARYIPEISRELEAAGLPQDLVYLAMIESGFNPRAVSPANAVGMWQFIRPTANRYGLKTGWWIDERRDERKSTKAAIGYLKDLYKIFGSWYLVAASYNMGENGVQRLVKRHSSKDFWELVERGALPQETTNYVPKILAAMLIAKAPALYGFRDLKDHVPLASETYWVPGGTDLDNLAAYLGVTGKYLQELNPELIKGLIPKSERGYSIRIPKGATATVAQYIQMQTATSGTY